VATAVLDSRHERKILLFSSLSRAAFGQARRARTAHVISRPLRSQTPYTRVTPCILKSFPRFFRPGAARAHSACHFAATALAKPRHECTLYVLFELFPRCFQPDAARARSDSDFAAIAVPEPRHECEMYMGSSHSCVAFGQARRACTALVISRPLRSQTPDTSLK
jgi:hypothetical protein